MNKVVLVGRLTKDPVVKYSQGSQPLAVARFTLAVDRRFKREGEQNADFISCVAFGKTGEFCEKYARKGVKFCISGRIQTGSYTASNGQKVYTTDVVAEEMEFSESKAGNHEEDHRNEEVIQYDGFMNVPDDIDEDLPFR